MALQAAHDIRSSPTSSPPQLAKLMQMGFSRSPSGMHNVMQGSGQTCADHCACAVRRREGVTLRA
jgi:hypothetical protein